MTSNDLLFRQEISGFGYVVGTYRLTDQILVHHEGHEGDTVIADQADVAYAIAYQMRGDGTDDYTIGAAIALLFEGDREAHEAGLGAISDWPGTEFGDTLPTIVERLAATR